MAARHTHCKSAGKERIADFKKNPAELIKSVPEHGVFYFEKASHAPATHRTRIRAKNGRPTGIIRSVGGRVHPYGLPGDGKPHHETYNELNTGNVVAFLRSIIEK